MRALANRGGHKHGGRTFNLSTGKVSLSWLRIFLRGSAAVLDYEIESRLAYVKNKFGSKILEWHHAKGLDLHTTKRTNE